MNEITITISAAGAVALIAAAAKYGPKLLNGKAQPTRSLPPSRDAREAKVATMENKVRIDNLTETCRRLTDLQEKTFDKIDRVEEQVGRVAQSVARIEGKLG